MVAAFCDPITETSFASSIPQGPRKAEMIEASVNNGAAPAWYAQVGRLLRAITRTHAVHAEDGAWYNYETSKGAQVDNGRYPDGSMIAIYGKY